MFWPGEFHGLYSPEGCKESDTTERLSLTQISQVKKFSAFLCMGRCKSLSSQKSFLLYASQLSGTNILCFPGLTIEGGCSLMGAGWQVLLFPPRAHWLTVEAAMVKDCDILVYWYGRKYSISQLYLLSSEITKTRQLGHHHQPLVHPVSPNRSRLSVLFWEPICIMGLCFEMTRSEHSWSSICKPLVLLWLSPAIASASW